MPCDNLDLEEMDIDMEELESRLYSQIYHSSTETNNENSFVFPDPPEQDNSSKDKITQETSKSVDVELTAVFNDSTSDLSNVSRDNLVDSFQHEQAEYISIESFSNTPRKRKNIEKMLRKRENRRLKRLRAKEKRKREGNNSLKLFNKLNYLNQPEVVDEIVVISDDEVSEVPLNETKEESAPKRFKSDKVTVEECRDQSSSDEDDVILVEVPNIVIMIDDDKEDSESTESDTSDDAPVSEVIQSISDTPASVETAAETAVLPNVKITKNSLMARVPSNDFEEAELLSIPESNSNDFLENVNLNRPDVLDNELDLTVNSTPDNVSYICDYDSQSSTNSSEAASPTLKTNFLFNTPQRELNLDEFTSYMASKSAFTPTASGDNTTPLGTPKSSKQCRMSLNDIETSSESEYDYVVKKIRNSDSEVQDVAIDTADANDVHLTPVLDDTTVWSDFSEEEEEEDDLDEDISIVELLNVDQRKKESKKSIGEKKEVNKKIETNKRVKRREKEDKKRLNFSDFWTEDMDKFYRESWGQEDFNVDEVKKSMPDDPNKWKIIHADQGGFFKTPQGRRCNLCRDFGHRAYHCPKKNYQPCTLCASRNHLDNNCPRSLCTTCGRPSRSQTNWCKRCNSLKEVKCKICHFRGHEEKRCPDLWRRYMFTTAEGPIQKIVDTTIKPSKDMWCSGCASSGHYQFDCRKRFNPYSSTSTRIHEFKEVYSFSVHETTRTNQQKDSSLFNKKDDTCNAINTLNSVRQHLKLSAKESEKLTGREGFEFLAQINRSTGLKFKIMTQNFKHRTRRYFCIIEGCESLITDAKFAIKNYCGGKSLSEVIHRKLKELDRPRRKWYNQGKALYQSIQKTEEKGSLQKNMILKQCKLGAKYSVLNMILIGKLMILDGRKHMENLRKFDADRTGKLLSNDVRTSYDYVFNKCERLKVDYRRLINDLPRFSLQHRKTMVKGTYKTCLMYCSKRKMFTKINNLNKLWKNVLDSKFSEDVVNRFCEFCSTIITMSSKKC